MDTPPASMPHDGGTDLLAAHVDALDKRMNRLETRLDAIEARLRSVETTLAGINSKLDLVVAQMPKWWQAPLLAGAVMVLILVLLALAPAKVFHLAG